MKSSISRSRVLQPTLLQWFGPVLGAALLALGVAVLAYVVIIPVIHP